MAPRSRSADRQHLDSGYRWVTFNPGSTGQSVREGSGDRRQPVHAVRDEIEDYDRRKVRLV
jgi:hypothetical protein